MSCKSHFVPPFFQDLFLTVNIKFCHDDRIGVTVEVEKSTVSPSVGSFGVTNAAALKDGSDGFTIGSGDHKPGPKIMNKCQIPNSFEIILRKVLYKHLHFEG